MSRGKKVLNMLTCKNKIVKKLKGQDGFTLLEVTFAAFIIAIVFVGLVQGFSVCFHLVETSSNLTLAIQEAQAKMEEIKNHDFDQIYADYNNSTFPVSEMPDGDGLGVIYVGNPNPDLLEVTIVVSWRQVGGRVIGEDTNLNGTLDAGEDNNGNGFLDSPAEIVTFIARP